MSIVPSVYPNTFNSSRLKYIPPTPFLCLSSSPHLYLALPRSLSLCIFHSLATCSFQPIQDKRIRDLLGATSGVWKSNLFDVVHLKGSALFCFRSDTFPPSSSNWWGAERPNTHWIRKIKLNSIFDWYFIFYFICIPHTTTSATIRAASSFLWQFRKCGEEPWRAVSREVLHYKAGSIVSLSIKPVYLIKGRLSLTLSDTEKTIYFALLLLPCCT